MSTQSRDKGTEHYVYYNGTALGSDIDLKAADPGGFGRTCNAITPTTSGALKVVRPDATVITLAAVIAGTRLMIKAKQITASGTTITGALVEWA